MEKYLCHLINNVILHDEKNNGDMKFIDGCLIQYQNIYSMSKEYAF